MARRSGILARHWALHQAKARFQRPDVGQVCPTYKPRTLFHFSIHTAISCAPSGRFARPLGVRGTSLAKRRVDDHAPIGGAGAPPSQRPNYFRIDLEMELD
jgi:hypothetical protein